MQVAIVLNTGKEDAKNLAKKTAKLLNKKGYTVFLQQKEAESVKLPEFSADVKKLGQCDLVIVLGGDGTILRTIRELPENNAPMLGVNLGKLGFLSMVSIKDFFKILDNFKEYTKEGFKKLNKVNKNLLEWRLIKNNITVRNGYALNDVMIHREIFTRIINISVKTNSSLLQNYVSDGIIVASPAGSTAYSLSAGGPVVSPKCSNLVVTPICPHSLYNRSIVLDASEQIKITPSGEFRTVIDGQLVIKEDYDYLKIKLSDKTVAFLTTVKDPFNKSLREKLYFNA